MKKTKGHYPYKQVVRFNGKRIIGKADEKELETLIDMLISDIERVYFDLPKEEIKKILSKSTIYFTQINKPTFSGADAMTALNKIFIDESVLEIVYGKSEKNNVYYSLLHEAIHVIQSHYSLKRRYKGHDIIGLIEGATENAVCNIRKNKRSTIWREKRYNFNSSAATYFPSIAIIRQLEVFFGKEIVDNFTYKQDFALIDLMINSFGEDFTYQLLDETSKIARFKESKFDFDNYQNYMFKKIFDTQLDKVNTVSEAELFLNKLMEYGKEIVRTKSNEDFRKYYEEILDKVVEKIPNFNITNYKYENIEYLPVETREDIEKRIKKFITSLIVDNNINNESSSVEEMISAINNLDINKIEIYKYENDNNIMLIANLTNDLCCLITVSNVNIDNIANINIKVQKTKEDEITFKSIDHNIKINKSDNLVSYDDKTISLEKTQLAISKKDIFNELKEIITTQLLVSKGREKRKYKLLGYEYIKDYDYDKAIKSR